MKPWQLAQQEISNMRKAIYRCPLGKKASRTTPPAQPPGPIRTYTSEEVFLENLKRFKPLKGGLMK